MKIIKEQAIENLGQISALVRDREETEAERKERLDKVKSLIKGTIHLLNRL